MADQYAEDIIRAAERKKAERSNWESFWQDVAEVVLPDYSNTFFTGGYPLSTGGRKDQRQFDNTANIALGRFCAVLESMITPRNSRWHLLQSDNQYLDKFPRVRAWYDDTNDKLFKYRYAPAANFASQCHETYLSLGAFGTGAMYIDRLMNTTAGQMTKGFRYASIHIAQVYFDCNHQGIIDKAYRFFKMSARNAVQKFTQRDGTSNLPAEIIKAASQNPDELYEFIHCVQPNAEMDPRKIDYRGMAYNSWYICKISQTTVLREGFHRFPYAISRYVTAPGELYGRSPAMEALANIKVLNEQKKTVLKQGHRTVDPILLAHDDGVADGFSMKPGALNTGAMTADGKRLIDVLPTGNLAVGDKMMQMEKDAINAAFMTDLFQILVEGPQMTATEVLERAREKGALMSPTMGRQQSELCGPMIEREIDLGMQQGLFLPLPPEMIEAKGEYKIVYDSPLSRMQRSEEAAGLMRTVQFAAEVASQTQNPAPLDRFNWDVIIPELADIQAVPQRWMNTDEQVAAIKQGRNQQAMTENLIKAGPTIASLAGSQQKPV